ncbi:hypothetical protein OROMI_023200 [Orobanche minor]
MSNHINCHISICQKASSHVERASDSNPNVWRGIFVNFLRRTFCRWMVIFPSDILQPFSLCWNSPRP